MLSLLIGWEHPKQMGWDCPVAKNRQREVNRVGEGNNCRGVHDPASWK